ncbi:hypothetical protein [Nostoc sp.]
MGTLLTDLHFGHRSKLPTRDKRLLQARELDGTGQYEGKSK